MDYMDPNVLCPQKRPKNLINLSLSLYLSLSISLSLSLCGLMLHIITYYISSRLHKLEEFYASIGLRRN